MTTRPALLSAALAALLLAVHPADARPPNVANLDPSDPIRVLAALDEAGVAENTLVVLTLLFHLPDVPGEDHDRSAEFPDRVAAMRSQLEKIKKANF